jgi:hypothetical protein
MFRFDAAQMFEYVGVLQFHAAEIGGVKRFV